MDFLDLGYFFLSRRGDTGHAWFWTFFYWVAMETFLLFDPTSFNMIRAIIMPLLFVSGCHFYLNYSKQIRVVYAGSRVRNNKALMKLERKVINKVRRLLRA